MVRTFIGWAVAGALLVGCHFEQGGLHWGADAGSPDDPEPDDPGSPDGGPSVDALEPADIDAAPTCEDQLADCPDGCVDLDTDDHNCGECDRRCRKDEICDQGQCVDDGGGRGH